MCTTRSFVAVTEWRPLDPFPLRVSIPSLALYRTALLFSAAVIISVLIFRHHLLLFRCCRILFYLYHLNRDITQLACNNGVRLIQLYFKERYDYYAIRKHCCLSKHTIMSMNCTVYVMCFYEIEIDSKQNVIMFILYPRILILFRKLHYVVLLHTNSHRLI